MDDERSAAELTAATASGIRWISLARVATELLLVGSMVVLARLIPPADFGLFALVVIVQELSTTPIEGVGSALVQRKRIERAHLQGGMLLSLGIGAALTVLTLALAATVVEPIYGERAATLITLAAPWFALCAVYALPIAVLRRRLDFRRLSLLDLNLSAVRSAVSIVLAAVFGLDALALVLGGLAGMVATLGLALIFAPVPFPRLRRQAIRDILSYGGPASLAVMFWTGFRNGDYAIVGARLGAAQAGFYWRGFQLGVEYQRKIATVMTQVAFPVLSRTTSTDELFALRRRMVRLLAVALFPLLALLVVLAPTVVPWLFGPAWEPAVLPTQILAGAGAATVVIDAVGSALMAAGRSRALLGYGIAHFAVYIAAVLVASGHGLAAVSAAAVAVHGVFLVVAYALLLHGRPERTLRFMWDDIGAATVGAAALVAVAWPVAWGLRSAGAPVLVELALVVPSGGLAYLAALRLFSPAAWHDLLAGLRRILPGRLVALAVAPDRKWLPRRRVVRA
jgi:O-antigen/teichoic acid export membrane protein